MRVTCYAPNAVPEEDLIDFLYFTKRRVIAYDFELAGMRSVTIAAANEDEAETFTLYAKAAGMYTEKPVIQSPVSENNSVLDGNAKSVIAALDAKDWTAKEASDLLEEECAGKNRISIIRYLEDQIVDLQEEVA